MWNTDKIKYFYKIKDITGYELRQVSIARDDSIQYFYYPISSDKSIFDKKLEIYVSYRRVDTIITDSYFNDYLEYYGDKNLTEDGFIFIKYDSDNYATIIFPVENTIIEIRGHGNMANYEALKKLCVAEKVVVE